MVEALVSNVYKDDLMELVEKIRIPEERRVVDILGPIRVWCEADDYSGINIEVVNGSKRLVAIIDPLTAVKLMIDISKILFYYLDAKHTYYIESIRQIEKKIDEKIEAVSKPSIIYAGNDEIAISRVSSDLREFKRLFHSYDTLTNKQDITQKLTDTIMDVYMLLDTIYRALHIV